MKKLLLSGFFVGLALCSLVIVASAKEAYLEPIQQRMGLEALEIKCINTFFLGFSAKKRRQVAWSLKKVRSKEGDFFF